MMKDEDFQREVLFTIGRLTQEVESLRDEILELIEISLKERDKKDKFEVFDTRES